MFADVVVDVPAGDIRDVIRAVADAHKLSVVVPGDLAGQASVRLAGVPWKVAMDSVLSPRGYRAREVSKGFVVVEKIPEKAKVEAVSSVYKLTQRIPSDLGDILPSLIREGETVKVAGDEVFLHAVPPRVSEMLSALRRWDVRPRQLEVKCEFREVTKGLSDKLGIDWAALGALDIAVRAEYRSGAGFSAVLTASQLSAVLAAFDSKSNNSVVSSPRVLATAGKEASFMVGQRYPVPQYTFARDTGVMSVSGFSFADVGAVLKFTPVFVGERVVLDLSPEVSHVVGMVPFGGVGGAEIPVVATRKVNTRVELRDGETVVLSGLASLDELDSQTGVKGLSRVPLAGALFRSKKKTSTAVELLIFVTVRFVSP
jgi:type II secretory pathway component HofQ